MFLVSYFICTEGGTATFDDDETNNLDCLPFGEDGIGSVECPHEPEVSTTSDTRSAAKTTKASAAKTTKASAAKTTRASNVILVIFFGYTFVVI